MQEKKEKTTRKVQLIAGIKAGIPVFIGFMPIAMTYAMLAMQAGLGSKETKWMSICVLAGASQMMAVTMYAMGTSAMEIIFATFILNFRHLIMSTYVMNRLKDAPLITRMLLAFGVTDESFAIFAGRKEEVHNTYFFAGLAGMTYFSWILGSAVGTLVLPFLPELVVKSMAIALYAMFIALLLPNVRNSVKIGIVVGMSMVLNFLLSRILSSGQSLIIATLAAAFIGTFIMEDKSAEQREELTGKKDMICKRPKVADGSKNG